MVDYLVEALGVDMIRIENTYTCPMCINKYYDDIDLAKIDEEHCDGTFIATLREIGEVNRCKDDLALEMGERNLRGNDAAC